MVPAGGYSASSGASSSNEAAYNSGIKTGGLTVGVRGFDTNQAVLIGALVVVALLVFRGRK